MVLAHTSAEERKHVCQRFHVTAPVCGATSSLLVAGAMVEAAADAAKSAPRSELALHGGEKAVREPVSLPTRWGQPEREQLDAMLGQRSLFWWKGPQNALLAERVREVCPLKYIHTCSSGTAALHIAVAAAGIGRATK